MLWIWNIEQEIFVHWTIVWNRQDWCWKIECRWFNVRWTVEKIYTWKCDSDVAFDFVSTVRPFTFFFEIKWKKHWFEYVVSSDESDFYSDSLYLLKIFQHIWADFQMNTTKHIVKEQLNIICMCHIIAQQTIYLEML